LILGGLGVLLISTHLIGHFGAFDWLVGKTMIATTDPEELFPERWVLGMIPIWVGAVLLATGSYLDIRGRWDARSTVLGCGSAEGYWRAPTEFAGLMERFYAVAADVITAHGGLIRGFIGDAVLAFFAPGFAGDDYSGEAVAATRDLLSATVPLGLAVGAGVHRGVCFAGLTASEVGLVNLDVKGDPVNVAARLASMARPGQALASDNVLGSESVELREVRLRGREKPVKAGLILCR
jgi:hypothetical protein